MTSLFDKAENYRSRSAELRSLAARVNEPAARTTLATLADALEEHARTLEAVAIRFGVAHRAAIRETAS
jgi:UDP-N-acetyl-D-mannosaminuronate dehydrogenase